MSALVWLYTTRGRRASLTQGQGLAEYGLMLVLIAIVAAVSLIVIGGDVAKAISNIGDSV